MTNADTPWPMKTSPTAEDYIATLATQVLLQAGCDHLPVNAVNLLRLVRQRTRQGDGSSVLSSSCYDRGTVLPSYDRGTVKTEGRFIPCAVRGASPSRCARVPLSLIRCYRDHYFIVR